MSRIQELEKQMKGVGAMVEMSSVFEGIASMRIAKIKNQVLQATIFFNDLWHIYTQLRVDSIFRFGRSTSDEKVVEEVVTDIRVGEHLEHGAVAPDDGARAVGALCGGRPPVSHGFETHVNSP